VAELKDNINTMIGNLRLTTDRNTEQDWLKTNLGALHQHAAGAARLGDRGPDDALGTRVVGGGAVRGHVQVEGDGAAQRFEAAGGVRGVNRSMATPRNCSSGRDSAGSARATPPYARHRHSEKCSADPLRLVQGAAASTSSCCRCCSKVRSRR